jgi:hypothetical protein
VSEEYLLYISGHSPWPTPTQLVGDDLCDITARNLTTVHLPLLVAPVFWFTPIELGGYGFLPKQISYLMAIGGAGQAFWTLVIFPSLHARVGSIGVLKGAAIGWCLMFCVYASVNLALRHGMSEALFWTIAVGCALVGSAISMSFTSVQLCLNDISPSPAALGTLNGVSSV